MLKKVIALLGIILSHNSYAALDSLDGDWVLKSDGQEVMRVTEDGVVITGAMRLPTITLSCSSLLEGSMRYNSGVVEVCTDSSWVEVAVIEGYFVLTASTYNGNLGGRSGADALCLAELTDTDNTFIGKNSATLNATTVKAFLTGNELVAGATYMYSAVNAPATLGISKESFTTDASGLGPDDMLNWSGGGAFIVTGTFWSDVGSGSLDKWAVGTLDSCKGFTDGTMSGGGGTVGSTDGLGSARWQDTNINSFCSAMHRLVCVVNPVD